MKNLFLTILFLTPIYIAAQDTLNYNFESKKFDKKGLKYKSKNIIKVESDNSAKLSLNLKSESKSFELSTPDVLKPIFGTALENKQNFQESDERNPLMDINNIINFLDFVSNSGLSLYKENVSIDSYRVIAKHKINSIITTLKNDTILYNSSLETILNDTLSYDYRIAKPNLKDTKYLKDKQIIANLKNIISEYNKITSVSHDVLKSATKYPSGVEMVPTLISMENSKYNLSMNSMSYLVNSLTAQKSFTSEEFDSDKDITELSLIFLNPITKDTIQKKNFNLINYRKLQTSFSTGFFVNRIIDKKYYIEPNPDTLSNYNFLKPENNNEIDISFGALLHFTYKVSPSFGLGFNAGAALSPFDAKTRYLIGSSLALGRKSQIAINLGFAFAKTDVLSNQIIENDSNLIIPKTLTTVPTQKDFVNSLYIGLSYNIFKIK